MILNLQERVYGDEMPKKLTSKEVEKLAEEEAQMIIKQKYSWSFKGRGKEGFDLLFENAEGSEKYVEVKGKRAGLPIRLLMDRNGSSRRRIVPIIFSYS